MLIENIMFSNMVIGIFKVLLKILLLLIILPINMYKRKNVFFMVISMTKEKQTMD